MQPECASANDAVQLTGQGTMTETAKSDFFSKIKSSFWGQVLYSTMTGLFGSLLLVLFLTGLMPLGETVRYLPWILGFNASVTGYTLLDGIGDRLSFPKLSGAGMGALVAMLVCNFLNVLTLKTAGIALMGAGEILLFIGISSISGGVGAWLTIAYTRIKRG
jgi:hypothetical protein